MKTLILLALSVSVWGQSPVNISSGPPPLSIQKLLYYDGSNNLQYVCVSPQNAARTTVQRTDSSLTSVVVLTDVGTVTTANAHGLYIGARVTISGATVDTDLNATYTVATVGSTTTYTIATVNVANATYTDATMVIGTTNPLATLAIWAVQVLTYNGSNYLTAAYWANGGVGYGLACTSRTSY